MKHSAFWHDGYDLKTNTFTGKSHCWVQTKLREYPIDTGRRIWTADSDAELTARLRAAEAAGEIET